MASEIRANSITSRAGLSTVTMTDSGPMFSGITTFVDNSTFSVGTGGTIHAPSTNTLNIGVNNTESLRIDSNSNLKVAGIVTATHFHGDGSNLTGITQTTINNNADNRIITGSGSANTLNGESTLTYSGDTLLSTNSNFVIKSIDTNASNSENYIQFNAGYITYDSDSSNSTGYSGHYFQADGSEVLRINGSGQLVFNADTNTYIARPAADTFAFTTNGSERLRIDSAGDIFIGTSTDIAPTNGTNLCVSDATVARLILEKQSTRRFEIGVQDFINIYDHTADTERLRIKSDGKVGINESTPTEMLHIKDDGNSDVFGGLIIKSNNGTVYTKYGWRGVDGSDQLRFAVGGTERLRITSAGLISLATTTTGNARLFVNPNVDGSRQRGITISGRKDVYDVTAINFVHATNNSSAGSIQFASTASVTYNTSSDYRLKQDVVTLTDSITKLKQLNPVHFKWKDMPSVETDGFLAHEVQTIIPSAITGEKDALDENGNIEPQQIDIGKLTPLLTSALQEAISKIETLEQDNIALRARVTNLEGN